MKGHSERGKSRRSPNILMLNMTSQGISTTAAGRGWLAALLLALDYKRSFDSLPFAAANGSFAQDDKA